MDNMDNKDFYKTFYECFTKAWQYAERYGNEELKSKLYTNPYRPILESLGYDLSFCKKNKEDKA